MTDNSLYEELCKIREQYLCRDCIRRFTDCQKMPRLIDADALFKVIAEQETWNVPNFVYESIQNAPTVEPVRHGHIVYRERYRKYYKTYTGFDENGKEHTITVCEDYGSGKEPYCSECGSQLAENCLNYCPNCGANMNEEIHNEL